MDFITVIISLAALLLSLLSYLRERRLITVDFDTNCFALDVTKNIKDDLVGYVDTIAILLHHAQNSVNLAARRF